MLVAQRKLTQKAVDRVRALPVRWPGAAAGHPSSNQKLKQNRCKREAKNARKPSADQRTDQFVRGPAAHEKPSGWGSEEKAAWSRPKKTTGK